MNTLFQNKWLKFLLIEVLLKTLLLSFVCTFVVALLLGMVPKVNTIEQIVRSSGFSEEELLVPSLDSTNIDSDSNTSTFNGIETTDIEISNLEQSSHSVNGFELYASWFSSLMSGELGTGKAGQPVLEEVKEKLGATAILSLFSLLIALPLAFLIGLSPYIKSSKRVSSPKMGRFFQAFLLSMTALPAFFLGYLLTGILGVQHVTFFNYLLAILTLGLSSSIINEMGRLVSRSMETEYSRDYVLMARAKGLPEGPIWRSHSVANHAFRNAIIRVFSGLASLFAIVISGSIIVEQVFGIHGLSYMLLDGLTDKDFSRVLIVVLLSVLLVRVGTLFSGLIYGLLNPKASD